MKKAQVSFEFLIAALVAMTLLLIGVTAYAQQTVQTNFITGINSDGIECNKIADAISEIYSSQGIAEKNIFVARENVAIQKIIGNPGQITVGLYSCHYFGNAQIDQDHGDTNASGISLTVRNYKLSKKGGFVVFTGQ
ncbi:MAG: hypothetical protein PHD95_02365 [Candidatus ainarchaeum sp.]|nr:hypothetical protein [Candidatus ainarchaeum sp.]